MLKQFTATAYIAAKIDNEIKVLLHRHKKLGIWCGMGGHVESEENPVEAVLREAKEESGLTITLIPFRKQRIKSDFVTEIQSPFMVLEEKIPEFEGIAEHLHIDLIYLSVTHNPESLQMPEEHGWFSLSDLSNLYPVQPEVKKIVSRIVLIAREYL